MMASCKIKGIDVKFPFEPYEIQKNYMEKVIECLQGGTNGVLESPTGTGKTLSLLCASLAWLEVKKAQLQLERKTAIAGELINNSYLENLQEELDMHTAASSSRGFLGMPTIIYASRTHSQLSQAMGELKRTGYSYMKATVLGSREQLCIHPDIIREENSAMKIHLCRLKVKTRSCHFYNRTDKFKDNPEFLNQTVLDIEDLVKSGQSLKYCPYYMAKHLKHNADIVFMPYNYLLDPKARKALGVELANNIIILDEAHNIEKMCEDSASIQIKTTDITLCIEEITAVMKGLTDEVQSFTDVDVPKDFTADELCVLKQMFLDFEKEFDKIELKNPTEGTTFDGSFIFELLEKAGIHTGNQFVVRNMIEKIVQFLTAGTADGPFQRKGNGLQLFDDLLIIAFNSVSSDFRDKIKKCYKVHITSEEVKKKRSDNWLTKATSKAGTRVLSFWCFSPGFGMNMLMNQGVHCVILTSGTLAPLRPLISELELKVGVKLENPHIVKSDQVCVKILTQGPDTEPLICNFQNRDNPKYLSSLGRTIVNLVRIIPNGVLIFFPSYPIMQKCQQLWQETGIWGNINEIKTIYVEPRDKISFNNAMTDYYNKIKDPNLKGAIFMGVCRGKVSEGLDFADMNGRAVFIIGLPYPPMKDPRVILKKRYLDILNASDKEYLRGDEWYALEATRAINQAIGRVIRHKDDYGAIILLDARFNNMRVRNQLSLWLRDYIKVVQNFGEIVRDIRGFFRNAENNLPKPQSKSSIKESNLSSTSNVQNATSSKGFFDFSSTMSNSSSSDDGLVTLRPKRDLGEPLKKKLKISVIPNSHKASPSATTIKEYIVMVKKALAADVFKQFVNAMTSYKTNEIFDDLINTLDDIFLTRPRFRYIILGLEPYIKEYHKQKFLEYCERMQ